MSVLNLSEVIRSLESKVRKRNRTKKSHYENIAMKMSDFFEDVEDLCSYAEAFNDWDYYSTDIMTLLASSSARASAVENMNRVLEYLESEIMRETFEKLEERGKKRAIRWRRAYSEVLKFLITNPSYARSYCRMMEKEKVEESERPMRFYTTIGRQLGYSWTTVRDAFWALRSSGVIPV
jgi:hypothetical protein